MTAHQRQEMKSVPGVSFDSFFRTLPNYLLFPTAIEMKKRVQKISQTNKTLASYWSLFLDVDFPGFIPDYHLCFA